MRSWIVRKKRGGPGITVKANTHLSGTDYKGLDCQGEEGRGGKTRQSIFECLILKIPGWWGGRIHHPCSPNAVVRADYQGAVVWTGGYVNPEPVVRAVCGPPPDGRDPGLIRMLWDLGFYACRALAFR